MRIRGVLVVLYLSFMSIYCESQKNIVIIGHRGAKGHLAENTLPSIAKAIDSAKKNLVKLPIYKGTLPHEQFAKFGGAKVLIKPASNGTGVKAGGAMRSVLESAGVKDVLAKSKGSSNPHNLVKATMLALLQLRDPLTVSRNRGIKMEKVFNG